MASTSLNEVLKIAVENNASDIHVKENAPVYYRIDGTMVGCDFTATRELMESFINQITNAKQQQTLENTGDDTGPAAAPISVPTHTLSPTLTRTSAGRPICIAIGSTTRVGGALRTGALSAVSFLWGTCTP